MSSQTGDTLAAIHGDVIAFAKRVLAAAGYAVIPLDRYDAEQAAAVTLAQAIDDCDRCSSPSAAPEGGSDGAV